MSKARILLVEDEANLRRTVADLLMSDGYCVESSGDGMEAQDKAMSQEFNLIILAAMLPSRNGFDVCRHLRKCGVNTPILMLSSLHKLSDKVQGFNAGADDYLTKPFETPELQARVEALLRRSPRSAGADIKSYYFGGMHVDFTGARITKSGKATALRETECRLLQYLIERRGIVLSRDELLREVWGYQSVSLSRTVDVHIAWLRQKIEDQPHNPQYIFTVHGEGYRFAR
jgi:two-component system alkaline phosphatase synthesis response regulator PhoP